MFKLIRLAGLPAGTNDGGGNFGERALPDSNKKKADENQPVGGCLRNPADGRSCP
jgi:hypothetical protein